jgi:hypothetical protein
MKAHLSSQKNSGKKLLAGATAKKGLTVAVAYANHLRLCVF